MLGYDDEVSFPSSAQPKLSTRLRICIGQKKKKKRILSICIIVKKRKRERKKRMWSGGGIFFFLSSQRILASFRMAKLWYVSARISDDDLSLPPPTLFEREKYVNSIHVLRGYYEQDILFLIPLFLFYSVHLRFLTRSFSPSFFRL